MFMKCCNPNCGAPFDYREGQLIRFSKALSNGYSAENHHLVEHFWLCGKCSGDYVFEYESGVTVKVRARAGELCQDRVPSLVSVA